MCEQTAKLSSSPVWGGKWKKPFCSLSSRHMHTVGAHRGTGEGIWEARGEKVCVPALARQRGRTKQLPQGTNKTIPAVLLKCHLSEGTAGYTTCLALASPHEASSLSWGARVSLVPCWNGGGHHFVLCLT